MRLRRKKVPQDSAVRYHVVVSRQMPGSERLQGMLDAGLRRLPPAGAAAAQARHAGAGEPWPWRVPVWSGAAWTRSARRRASWEGWVGQGWLRMA